MKKLQYYISNEINPWHNLAVEEALFRNIPKDTIILYLWKNHRTVVIGRNQNSWVECNVKLLEQDGGYLARRLSGGGCVYHDENNLNFTFLANEEDYDVDMQMEVILQAVKSFGLEAVRTGRNDIAIDGRKFSGNAFYKKNGKCYHHGTILIDTDTENMNRYLNVSKEKLRSKGVASVKSRVINLKELSPYISVESMKKALISAGEKVYGIKFLPAGEEIFDNALVTELEEKNASWEWRYGRKISFTWEKRKRFEWGEIDVLLNVNGGVIQNAIVYSDAIDADLVETICQFLHGKPFDNLDPFKNAVPQITKQQRYMLEDVCSMIMEENS